MRGNAMRTILFVALGLLLGSGFAQAQNKPQNSTLPEIVVYRSPSCGCCGKWLAHLTNNQFNVVDKLVEDVQGIKNQNGVSPELASCHTALVDGYVVEGHVPANDIKKLLANKPKVVGIAVPGMPVGTPGMEMGAKKDAYQVVSFDKDKKTQVFSEYGAE
jgi:hypothetical protein